MGKRRGGKASWWESVVVGKCRGGILSGGILSVGKLSSGKMSGWESVEWENVSESIKDASESTPLM